MDTLNIQTYEDDARSGGGGARFSQKDSSPMSNSRRTLRLADVES